MSDDWQVVEEALNESCSDWQLHNKYLAERPDWYENGHAALARLREREARERRSEWREGIVNVLDHEGNYLGCLGSETWAWTLDGGIEKWRKQYEDLRVRYERLREEKK